MATEKEKTKGQYERQSPARESMRRFIRHRSAQVGLAILLGLVLIAIFAPVIAPYDPIQILKTEKRRSAPCIHLLGCDPAKTEHIMELMGTAVIFFPG